MTGKSSRASATRSLLAAHADWSVAADKRWVCQADNHGGIWQASLPALVGDPGRFLPHLLDLAVGAPVALGVDFPLGLPRTYAQRHLGQADFPAFLRSLHAGSTFFDVCRTLDDLRPERPFYPQRGRKGMTRAAHAGALGLQDADALSRACDRATHERPAGAPPFWTLGANQSGKAAIAAWRDMLCPALAARLPVLLWPFAGNFRALLRPGCIALAETYPAQAMRLLKLQLRGSKRRQPDRAALAPALLDRMRQMNVRPDRKLTNAIRAGFDSRPHGEDQFDSLLGLLNVIAVVDGHAPGAPPDDPMLRIWEGWVLGQTALPANVN